MPGASPQATQGAGQTTVRPPSPSSARRLFAVKLVHSIIFWFQVACLAYLAYAAFTRSLGWPVLIPIGSILLNGVLLLLNHGRCPFTTLAERTGAASGSVTDLFLPDWIARNIFRVSTAIFAAELVALAVRYFGGV